MATTYTSSGTEAAGPTIARWTPETLETQILGELNQHRNAAGGTVPARIINVVQEAYEAVWEEHEWPFRQRRTDLATVASNAVAQLPTDFQKLAILWSNDTDENGRVRFTEDMQLFEQVRADLLDAEQFPRIGLIERDTTTTATYRMSVRFAPTPDAVYTLPLVYFCFAPTLETDESPLWPPPFNRGWAMLARARALRAFRGNEAWKEPMAAYQNWLEKAKSVDSETMESGTPAADDGYGDVRSMMSNARAIYG